MSPNVSNISRNFQSLEKLCAKDKLSKDKRKKCNYHMQTDLKIPPTDYEKQGFVNI